MPFVRAVWGWLEVVLLALVGIASLAAATHALLAKRRPQSALGWVVVCLAWPALGPLAYGLFGVNRIKSRGRELRARYGLPHGSQHGPQVVGQDEVSQAPLYARAAGEIARVGERVTRRPLVRGNLVTPLYDGDQAYPALHAAIDGAERAVWLATYIFDTDATGRALVDALARAAARGVEVRVLLDGVGELYSWPRAGKLLARRGVRVARFLPPLRPGLYINLRNHRKLAIVDQRIGFTGGMNVGDRHLSTCTNPRKRARDIHFRVEGPVVAQLEDAFAEDWRIAAGELLAAEHGVHVEAGESHCRSITDGPNEDFRTLTWILLGAVNAARVRVRIMTPYFLPDEDLMAALSSAAQRGIAVEVLLPGYSNQLLVHWATRAILWQMLEQGVRVLYQPPPFVHSKLLLVDERYALVGSANLDPRSLRLNFEHALEIFGAEPAGELHRHFDAALARSREVTQAEVDGRRLAERVRDALCKLFIPYL